MEKCSQRKQKDTSVNMSRKLICQRWKINTETQSEAYVNDCEPPCV